MIFATAGVASHAQVPVQGGQPAPAQPPVAAAPAQPATPRPGDYPKVSLTAGRSTVLTTDFDITRIAITNPAIADATVVAPREILIDGKAAGTISLIVWGERLAHAVRPGGRTAGAPRCSSTCSMLFPGEDITVSTNEEATILSGQRLEHATSCCGLARLRQTSQPKAQVINLLRVPGGSESQQVLLQVRFAEVNRTRPAGAGGQPRSWRNGKDFTARVDDAAVYRRRASTTTS